MPAHIVIKTPTECYGCRACEQVCPMDCILMQVDTEGFIYPKVDTSRCTSCGLCRAHCPFLVDVANGDLETPKVYAAKLKDDKVLSESSSGGVFSAIAGAIIDRGGVVFGCGFDENFVARHVAVDSKEGLSALRGSKYVASDLGRTYSEVRALLQSGRQVLYSGTGCNIAGLKAFLGKEYPLLTTVDILCHGTPSQKLFSRYIEHLDAELGEKILTFEFRNKQHGGWGLFYRITTKSKTISGPADRMPYYASFLKGSIYRYSCYACKFACPKRNADFTLADYWGLELFHPDFYDRKGVSLLLINSTKGSQIFQEIETTLSWVDSRMEWAQVKNGNLIKPTVKPTRRDGIYDELDSLTFTVYEKKYLALRGSEKWKAWIKNAVPKRVRICINRLIGAYRNTA